LDEEIYTLHLYAGSPKREHSSREEDSVRDSHHHSRKFDTREQDTKYARSSDSLRHSDRHSSRTSYGHSRHDKYADEYRKHERLSSRSARDSRGDQMREDSDSRSKDYGRSMDKYPREKYERSDFRSKDKDREKRATCEEVEKEKRTRDGDARDEKKDSQRSSGEHKSDRALYYSESRSQKDDIEISKNKDRNSKKVGDVFGIEDKESSGKKQKLFGADKDANSGKDGIVFVFFYLIWARLLLSKLLLY